MSTLAQALLRTAESNPDALALVDDERSWTHGEWAADVDQARQRLRTFAIARGESFAWLGLNSVAMLSMLVACSLERVRFLPLNGRLTAHELALQLVHGDVHAWHVDASLRALGDAAWVARGMPLAPHGDAQTDDVMLVYTSGTTGDPRGAIHTQAAMVANLHAAVTSQGIDSRSRTLAVLPMFHVGGLCIQTLPTLAAGGAVRLQARFDAHAWLSSVESWKPTSSLMVPATMHAVVAHAAWAGSTLSSLQSISAGSSVVPKRLIDAFHARGVPVLQVYGATETGPVSIVLGRDEAFTHAGKAGRAAPGVEVQLVDSEIWVRAANLARGYHRRAGDENFTADGWFRTGDLAVEHDGLYEVVGRRKELIISGGENIHPAEVEQATADLPGVVECAVVGVPDAQWGEVPVLALVPTEGGPPSLERLQAHWLQRLAKFKHPRRVHVVDALPKTALGKVKRAELAERLIKQEASRQA